MIKKALSAYLIVAQIPLTIAIPTEYIIKGFSIPTISLCILIIHIILMGLIRDSAGNILFQPSRASRRGWLLYYNFDLLKQLEYQRSNDIESS